MTNTAKNQLYYLDHREDLLARSNMYNTTHHREQCIRRWKRKGMCLRPEETWDGVYDNYMTTAVCDSCEVELDDDVHNTHRCNDHMHEFPFYIRGTICSLCNKNDQWRRRMTPSSIYQIYQTYKLLTK